MKPALCGLFYWLPIGGLFYLEKYMIDILQNDAFKASTLTAAINKVDFIPGRAGEVAFVGAGEGISTTSAQIEVSGETLSLVQSQLRGAPVQQVGGSKRSMKAIAVPHIPLEATIRPDEIQNVREFGSDSLISGATNVVNQRMSKMANRLDLTVENLRLGALKGKVLDADGSELVNLYTTFGVAEPSQVNFSLTTAATDVRKKCADVIRSMKKSAKMSMPSTARVHAFVGSNFMDALISHVNVKEAYAAGQANAERRLAGSYVHGIFEFGGIYFEEYQGSDDDTVGIASDEVRFFFADAPGLYAEYYAPGDFLEAVNSVGLPRYAKMEEGRFGRSVDLHVQTNPLPICLRPATLFSGRKS